MTQNAGLVEAGVCISGAGRFAAHRPLQSHSDYGVRVPAVPAKLPGGAG